MTSMLDFVMIPLCILHSSSISSSDEPFDTDNVAVEFVNSTFVKDVLLLPNSSSLSGVLQLLKNSEKEPFLSICRAAFSLVEIATPSGSSKSLCMINGIAQKYFQINFFPTDIINISYHRL